jgi:hypothetical protein
MHLAVAGGDIEDMPETACMACASTKLSEPCGTPPNSWWPVLKISEGNVMGRLV